MTNSFSPKQDHYVCSNYKSNTGTCSAHFIREETLKLFVLQRIFDVTALFFDDAMAFEEAARKQRFQEAEKDAKKRKHEIAQAEKRIAELDRIFKRIYEDDINGAISHERFLKLSADYEAEQKELTEQVKAWRLSLIHILSPISGMEELVRTLQEKGIRCLVLSNASVRFPVLVERFSVLRRIDERFVSAFYKLVKPTRAIYERFLAEYSLKAEECVFFDDLQANVDGAAACGIDVYKRQQRERGVRPPAHG